MISSKKLILKIVACIVEPFILIAFLCLACAARFVPKKIDIGLGPLPLINNIYHKKVFQSRGYTAETFALQVWHITSDFDIRADQHPWAKIPKIGYRLNLLRFMAQTLFRYRCILIYFDGSVMGVTNTTLLWRFEPFLYALANVKTLVLAYGSDVQDMSRSPNLLFKNTMSKDYPLHKNSRKRISEKIDLWTSYGDHVIGGCEWVDYMHHWDTLMISHFSIDENQWEAPAEASLPSGPLRVLHAPNHRAVKGTSFVINAVNALRNEGLDIELVLVEKKSNSEIKNIMASCHVVVDQLIVGWYAMFAIEAMAMGKVVVCNIRSDLERLYRVEGLLSEDEKIPMIHACPLTIKGVLRDLYLKRHEMPDCGEDARSYVIRHHSLRSVAETLCPILSGLIGKPSGRDQVNGVLS